MNWFWFLLGVGATLAAGLLALPLWWLYRFTCTDWETGAFVPPLWWKKLRHQDGW